MNRAGPPPTNTPKASVLFSDRAELLASIAAGSLLGLFWLARFAIAPMADPLAWLALAIGMLYGGRAAVQSLAERKFDIDVLMVLAAGLAAWTGHPEDGALLLFLFVLSGALEARAMRRAQGAVEALGSLIPDEALVRRAGTAGETWSIVKADTLIPGDHVRLRTGDRVAADGLVTQGRTAIDQSSLTGESLPRDVREGDALFAGTINLNHPVEMEVTKAPGESSIQRILKLVTQAQEEREPVQRFIDRVGQPYAIAVVALSAAVLLLWRFALGREWLGVPGNAVDAAIVLLIVMSPCALVIATPTATLAAISRAAREGVLFKGGQAIERLARLGALSVDKTGTLTVGKPTVIDIAPAPGSDAGTVLAIAAGLEAASTHPIAVAIRDSAKSRTLPPTHAANIRFVAGKGLRGVVGGAEAALGTLDLAAPIMPAAARSTIEAALARAREAGHIAAVLAAGSPTSPVAGVIVLADPIRPTTTAAIASLREMGVKPIVMLTGDHAQTAQRIAQTAGVDSWHAGLLPEDKVRLFRQLAAQTKQSRPGAAVGVMGDGVNDAPSLALADVSIAIGSIGSDAAMESADTVLLSDNMHAVPWALDLARRARRTILANIIFALGVIACMAIAALIASYVRRDLPLPVAVIVHEGGTLLVVLNSLRLTLVHGLIRPHAPAVSPQAMAAPIAPEPAEATA